MNGSIGTSSNNNHTLSPRQAKELLKSIDGDLLRCKRDLENHTNDLLQRLSAIWADKNAVSFAGDVKKRIDGVISALVSNFYRIKINICDIANAYAKAGGNGNIITADRINATTTINTNVVKESFDGDEFGFKDSDKTQYIIESISNYSKIIREDTEEFLHDISCTNAFGNTSIIMSLQRCGQDIVNKLETELNSISVNAKANIEKTKYDYEQASRPLGEVLNDAVVDTTNAIVRLPFDALTSIAGTDSIVKDHNTVVLPTGQKLDPAVKERLKEMKNNNNQ